MSKLRLKERSRIFHKKDRRMLLQPTGREIPSLPSLEEEWGPLLLGPSSLSIITAIAARVFESPPFTTLCWGAMGTFIGVVAKKPITQYHFLRSLSRMALSFENNYPHVLLVALGIACVASFIFPYIAFALAAVVGFRVGCLM
jgi:hypothetical protein